MLQRRTTRRTIGDNDGNKGRMLATTATTFQDDSWHDNESFTAASCSKNSSSTRSSKDDDWRLSLFQIIDSALEVLEFAERENEEESLSLCAESSDRSRASCKNVPRRRTQGRGASGANGEEEPDGDMRS